MLNNPSGTLLVTVHQPDISHPLRPDIQLLFSSPSSLFLQSVFLQLLNENAEGDGIQMILKSRCITFIDLTFSTQSHCCRRQSVLTISDCLLYPFISMSVNGFQEDMCHHLYRNQSEASWPAYSEVPQVIPLVLLNNFLLVFFLLSQTSPHHHDLSGRTSNALWNHIS